MIDQRKVSLPVINKDINKLISKSPQDINKFEKLDTEDKLIVEEKLNQIKELQKQITNLLVWK